MRIPIMCRVTPEGWQKLAGGGVSEANKKTRLEKERVQGCAPEVRETSTINPWWPFYPFIDGRAQGYFSRTSGARYWPEALSACIPGFSLTPFASPGANLSPPSRRQRNAG